MRLGLYLTAEWICFVGLWFLFVYQLSLIELVVGASVAAVTIGAFHISLSVEPLRFRPKLRWFRPVLSLPFTVTHDMDILLRALIRLMSGKPIPSSFQVTHFSAPAEGPRTDARRALAVAFTTVSPNSVVAGIDRKTGLVLFHTLKRTPVPEVLKAMER